MLSFVAASACGLTGGGGERSAPPALPGWSQAIGEQVGARFMALPAADSVPPLVPGSGMLVVDPWWRLPTEPSGEPLRQALRQFVEQGGNLVLFGHAAHLVAELGIEAEYPERELFRWGYDARTTLGRATLGLAVVSGRLPELYAEAVAGVATDAAADLRVPLCGGQPCTVPLCGWSIGTPRSGEVLARLWQRLDDREERLGPPVLVRWSHGRGAVLACGLLPDLQHADPAVRSAAQSFVRQCAAWAGGSSLQVVVMPPRESAAPLPLLPAGAPLLAHWGWVAPAAIDGQARTADEALAEVVTPSWLSGADLCEFELIDADGASPLGWRPDDPLQRAPSWRDPSGGANWRPEDLRRLCAELHGRGMLASAALEPLPVGARTTERYVALRYLARELADVRQPGSRAFDAFVTAPAVDRSGYGLAMVQDFHPALRLLRRGELAAPLVGSLRGLDADDGALPGLPWRGLSDRWRGGFPPDLFPVGVLDAQARRTGPAAAGGSRADWIVTQANDFVRSRRGQGAALWWRRHDPAAFEPDTEAYVHGVSLEPLRAAVAMPLAATGSDGLRAAAAVGAGAPPGFGAEVDAPAAVHVLQNNWFRLLGSGGSLRFDPQGLARFGAEAVELSPGLLRTRLFGGRPDGSALRSDRLDLLAFGHRGSGGYGAVARVGAAAGSERLPPGVLACFDQPQWPAAVWFEWQAAPGYHELQLTVRAVRGRGLVAVSLDGVLLRALSFADETAVIEAVVPVHVARGGLRQLQFEILDGGACAFDRLLLTRTGDVGVEANVVVPAGNRAELVEHSQSSYHQERVELIAQADFAGFVVRLGCERAARNLQIERTFVLPGYDQLIAGDAKDALRRPFLLRGRGRPDLVITPLLLARYDTLRWQPGELVLRSAPEAGLQCRLGWQFAPAGTGDRLLAAAPAMLGAVDQPLPLELGTGGSAVVVGDLPLAGARLVHLLDGATTPFLVHEPSGWSWRGTMPATGGGRWLRIHQQPGQPVTIVGGPAVLARTRPGPGSLHVVRLRDPQPGATIVDVLQPSRLAAPSVVMGQDFDGVLLDDQPWHWFHGRTVFLPDRVGSYRLRTLRTSVETPHVRATAAPLQLCRYVPERGELLLNAAGEPGRPVDLPWTAVLGGPRPIGIDNGELVDDGALRFADVEQKVAAGNGGIVIRFRPGVTKVLYAH
jgi:hypothetical protein